MKRLIFAIFIIGGIVLMPVVAAAASDSSTDEPTRYFLSSTKSFWRSALNARHSFEDGFTADLSPLQLRVAKFAGLKPVAVKRLTILPAEPAGESTADIEGGKPLPKRLTPINQIPWGVELITNTDAVLAGGASISIAVLDTGVTGDHPDLTRRITACKDFTQTRQPIVDGKCTDQNGHGTHVAGIIAADGGADGKGIYGVAPAASLAAYKVCNANGSCWSDDIAMAIRTAADADIQIINLSLGSDTISSLVADAVAYAAEKEVLVIAAAGNDGPYAGSIDWPGALVDVVAVGAIDANLHIANWSSRGINADTDPYSIQERDLEFAAPGVSIESTYGGGYAVLSGTSMAAPHVAGLAALLWQATAEYPAAATRELLHDHAQDILPIGDDEASGWGLPVY